VLGTGSALGAFVLSSHLVVVVSASSN
jgi:hypothetical protein